MCSEIVSSDVAMSLALSLMTPRLLDFFLDSSTSSSTPRLSQTLKHRHRIDRLRGSPQPLPATNPKTPVFGLAQPGCHVDVSHTPHPTQRAPRSDPSRLRPRPRSSHRPWVPRPDLCADSAEPPPRSVPVPIGHPAGSGRLGESVKTRRVRASDVKKAQEVKARDEVNQGKQRLRPAVTGNDQSIMEVSAPLSLLCEI